MKVLVAYASKAGSTKGIAEFVGEKLRQQGIQADVQDVGVVRNAADYDAFVIGSAVYMFHWMKEAKRFVSKNNTLLVSRPVWLFSSGPVGAKSTDAKGRDLLEVSGPKELDELRALVKPRDHRVFFGVLDGSRLTGTTGFTYKLVRRSQAAREAMPEGDFRDWKKIEDWVSGIAHSLVAPEAPQP
jgi:menaquinone-dependent protoporphyrinogen oxidase